MANDANNKNKSPKPAAKKPAQTNAAKKPAASKPQQKSNKSAKAQQAELMQRNSARRQIISSVLFALALLLLCVTIVPSGVEPGESNLWQGLKDVFFGIFGVCAFIVPFAMLYTAYVLAKDRAVRSIALRVVGIVSVAICLSSIIYVASNPEAYLKNTDFSFQVKQAWEQGISNGGFTGVVFGCLITKLFGKAGGLITVIILLFAMGLILTGTTVPTLIRFIVMPIKSIIEFAQQRFIQSHNEESERKSAATAKNQSAAKSNSVRGEYRRPQPKKTLNERRADNDFFADDFDPFPQKPDDIIEPIDSRPAEPAVVPVFNPVPTGINLDIDIQPNDESEVNEFVKFISDNEDADENIVPIEFAPAPTLDNERTAREVVELIDKAGKQADSAAQQTFEDAQEEPGNEPEIKRAYVMPDVECLAQAQSSGDSDVKEELTANAQKLVETLRSFNIETKIVDIARGPSVTRYEIQPAPGIKISRIAGLADDIAMNLAASGVRIEAPIPNKAAVGIEIPNRTRLTVTLREIVDSPQFKVAKSKLNVALGKDISGNVTCTDLAKMPHLLIAGTTGSGKSVCLNAMIVSILFNSTPDEVKLIMIDPKQVEFTVYQGIPHLMVPVVSDPRKAAGALAWAVSEMLKRYKMFSEKGVRDIGGYNKLAAKDPEMQKMFQIVIFIDELSDLMMVAQNEVEDSICRLAQMARAAGMHLVIATQRPSVNVITGIIKANIPSRIALFVSSQVDSRTIIDTAGAEKLLGNGDMLFSPVGVSKPVRLQGCYVSEEEVERVVDFIKTQGECEYDSSVMEEIERQAVLEKKKGDGLPDPDSSPDSAADEETMRAIEVVVENQLASTTLLQRKLKIGYAKAARIMDELEEKGIIGPFEGSKPRKVLMSKQRLNEMRALGDMSAMDMGSEE